MIKKIQIEKIEMEKEDFRFDEDEEEWKEESKYAMVGTPYGNWPVDHKFNPYFRFRMYAVHTNFYVTNQVYETVTSTPGIEFFDPISPYQFIIAIGRLFEEQDVVDALKSQLEDKPFTIESLPQKFRKDFLEVYQAIEKPHWVIYQFPNGEIVCNQTNSIKDHKVHVAGFELLKETSNGIILSSDTPHDLSTQST